MKTIAAVLLTSAFFMGDAYAQSPAPYAGAASSRDASATPMRKSDAERNMDVQRHIGDLHARLNITPAEESLWSAVAKTMADNANELDLAIDKREDADTTAVDDLNAYGVVVQAHADGVKKLSAVFSPLYASMSDDQKKVADEVFAQRAHEGKNNPQALK